MMGMCYKSGGYIILTDHTYSRLRAIQAGFKDIIEREKPEDYSPDTYTIEYEDVGQWILMSYRKNK